MHIGLPLEWEAWLGNAFNKDSIQNIMRTIEQERLEGELIFPEPRNIFAAFSSCPLSKLKLVILGQDPYHTAGMANGLSFSVPAGAKLPPSLKNIFKELYTDLAIPISNSGDLSAWAKQGVLLLNTCLTVQKSKPFSHNNIGWQQFTDQVIQMISQKEKNVVFMLWGKHAQQKKNIIDAKKHCVLEAAHPSPFSAHAGFFGCKHFSRANDYFIENGLAPINWILPNASSLF